MAPIQRILFLTSPIHVYPIPPGTGLTGHTAKSWNVDNPSASIFTGRLRVIETTTYPEDDKDEEGEPEVRVDVSIETEAGELFANCPYDNPAAVEQVTDSSRFFAIRVVHGKQKATLGIGFEERSEAFDFGVALQDARRRNGIGQVAAGKGGAGAGPGGKKGGQEEEKRDYSLKEGETISITIGNKGRRKPPSPAKPLPAASSDSDFPIPILPPPPSAEQVRKRQSMHVEPEEVKMGFDDDDFGDFV